MVFRRSLRSVTSRDAYLGGAAHPAAFAGTEINAARMVSLANAIEADAIPPQVRLAVLEEDLGQPGVDFFGDGLSEQLFDTPAAVARVWRSKAGRRSILVSAAETRDPNGRALAFDWRLLQGDPAKVRIEPMGDGSTARITLDWHDPFPVSEDDPTPTARIDVGVFASNGVHDSAPAILSWYCPPTETRSYAAPGPATAAGAAARRDRPRRPGPRRGLRRPAPRAARRLARRIRHRRGRPRHRLDPPPRGRDPEAFTADGARILDRDAGRPRPPASRPSPTRSAATPPAGSSSRSFPPAPISTIRPTPATERA